jgi:hypothetical protein
MEENGRMSRAQYCEQSTFDWRRYSHWKLEVEKARLAAFLLCGGVRTRPMLVKPVLLPPALQAEADVARITARERKAGSQKTPRWSKPDSNPWSHRDKRGSLEPH